MSNAAYLKERYEGMDTASLLDLWARGGLVDWAEHVLREELQRRNVSADELENLAAARAQHQEDIAARRGRSELRSIGLFTAAFLGGILATILGSLWDQRAGMVAFGVVFGGYGVLLAQSMRHLRTDVKQPGSSINSVFDGFRQIVFVFVITALCIYGGLWGM
jgi:hypothetical protein